MERIKTVLRIAICGLLALFCAETSFATPYGTYIGTGTANDNVDGILVNLLITAYNEDNDPDVPAPVTYLSKYEIAFDEDADTSYWEDGIDGGFTVNFLIYNDEGEPISGTWSSSIITSLYYSIKVGTSFDLYYVDPVTLGTAYTWDTTGLSDKGLSHLTFWTPNSSPVPEPATMLLFGTGLAGIAGVVRKRTRKA
ncbi:MAG: PEP-CTERM sorting domain-containing protein [Thermodesulfobacteriota bacterium]